MQRSVVCGGMPRETGRVRTNRHSRTKALRALGSTPISIVKKAINLTRSTGMDVRAKLPPAARSMTSGPRSLRRCFALSYWRALALLGNFTSTRQSNAKIVAKIETAEISIRVHFEYISTHSVYDELLSYTCNRA